MIALRQIYTIPKIHYRPYVPSIHPYHCTQPTRDLRYMTMMAMSILAPIPELPETSTPSNRTNIQPHNNVQQKDFVNNNKLDQNAEILQRNTTKMMQVNSTIIQDNLRIAENYWNILEQIKNHLIPHPPTKKKTSQ